MKRVDYLQEMQEAMTLVKEYASTYRFLKEQFRDATIEDKSSIFKAMNAIYEAWVHEISRYAHLAEAHCGSCEEMFMHGTISYPDSVHRAI